MAEIPPCESLIELEDVLVTAGGSELALTGGDGQVIKADHHHHQDWHHRSLDKTLLNK